MVVEMRTIGNQTGYFVSHVPNARVAAGPFETEKAAQAWAEKYEAGVVGLPKK